MPSRFHSQQQELRLPILLLLLLAAATEDHQLMIMVGGAEQPLPITLKGCPDKCGHTSIPYPFGMTPGCFRPGFEVVCNHSFIPPRAFLAPYKDGLPSQKIYTYTVMVDGTQGPKMETYNLVELVDVSIATSEARVRAAVASLCSVNATGFQSKIEQTYLGGEKDPFRLSAIRNVLVGVGVVADPFIPMGMVISPACTSRVFGTWFGTADNGSCCGKGCCVEGLPTQTPPLTEFGIGFFINDPRSMREYWDTETAPCSYGMVVERLRYNFSTPDLYGYDGLSNRLHRGVPVVLDFAIRSGGDLSYSYCPAKGQQPPADYACVSGNSSCSNATTGGYVCFSGNNSCSNDLATGGYVCKCWDNYHGNPYIANGCQDIDECEMRKQSHKLSLKFPCFGICKNKVGGYDCPCKFGMKGDAKKEKCSEIFPLVSMVVLGIAAFVVVCVLTVMSLQHLKLKRFYEQNGGPVLKGVKNIRIYRRKQLKQITNNYKHVIGEGHFGKVYMGTEEKQQVAIKISSQIDKDMKQEFTDEVIIQSEMRHKNIVRLLGCCLEVDAPVLVYEYVARGSLYDVLFGLRRIDVISVDTRLRIAVGSAEGLAYMHSAVESTIRHGDVKSANILLDQNFTPKVSDFGTTRLLARGKAEKTDHVIGDKSYIDPVYMEEGIVTQKSDVYSFGVILIELITRRPAVYDNQRRYVTNFVQASLNKEARSSVDTAITSEVDIKLLEMVGEVAVECLQPNIEERLDMKQVEQCLNQIIERSAQYLQNTNYQADPSPAMEDIPLLKD